MRTESSELAYLALCIRDSSPGGPFMTERQRCLGVLQAQWLHYYMCCLGLKSAYAFLIYTMTNVTADGTGFVHVSDAGRAGAKYIFKRSYA